MFIKKVDTFYKSNLDGLIFIQKKKKSSYMGLYQPYVSYTESEEQ